MSDNLITFSGVTIGEGNAEPIVGSETTPVVDTTTTTTPEPDQTTIPVVEDQTQTTPEETPATAWYQEAATVLGIELAENDVFDSSVEGITSLVSKAATDLAAKQYNAYLNSNPELRDIASFINNGGNLKDYLKVSESSWATTNVTETDESTQAAVVKLALKSNGINDTVIDSLIESAKANKTLFSLAKDQLKTLQTKEASEKAALLEQQQRQVEEYNNKIIAEQQEIKTIVSKGFVNNYIIPTEQREAFVNAYYGSDENSITALYEKMNTEEKLAVALFIQNKAKPLQIKKASTNPDMFVNRTNKTGSASSPAPATGGSKVISTVNYNN
jgi:hypothetical protein